ncbi:MAG: hypothetical protein WCD37_02550 [Chloroflexia bacterium]
MILSAEDDIADIIMCVVPWFTKGEWEPTKYAISVFSSQEVPGLQSADVAPTRYLPPNMYMDLPLQTTEFLDAGPHFRDDKGPSVKGAHDKVDKYDRQLRSRIRSCLSPGLASFFERPVPLADGKTEYRVWWDCKSTPLAIMPWETIIAETDSVRLYFVRGAPPSDPSPTVPFHDQLKLAVIGQPLDSIWPKKLWEPLRQEGLQIDEFPGEGSAGLALRKAVAEDYDLIHLVASGITNTNDDGLIYLGGDPEQRLEGYQLRSMFKSSRVAALAFSFPGDMRSGIRQFKEASTSYQAFATIANMPEAGPSIVTQLRRSNMGTLIDFWRAYYAQLMASGHIVRAVDVARRAVVHREPGQDPAMALFLNHRTGHLYERIESQDDASDEQDQFESYVTGNIEAQLDESYFAENVGSAIKRSLEQARSDGDER